MTCPAADGSGVAIQQNQARGRDVERQAEQRQQQQNGGKTLNSTGRPMYMATIMTMTDIMRSSTIRKSRMKLGSGRDQSDDDQQHRDGYGEFARVGQTDGRCAGLAGAGATDGYALEPWTARRRLPAI